MFVLLESFDEDGLRRTNALLAREPHANEAQCGQLLVGVNTRNLRTLNVDGQRLDALASLLPAQATCVAESGIHNSDDVAHVASIGYRMALVGSALMRSDDPQQLVAGMVSAGRAA